MHAVVGIDAAAEVVADVVAVDIVAEVLVGIDAAAAEEDDEIGAEFVEAARV